MTTQPIQQPHVGDDYTRLLRRRIDLGRLFMDFLCHGRQTAPEAVMLFRRVLHLDAVLSADDRYDRDHLELVSVREDARYHQPPRTVPEDHDIQPCGLCRKLGLDLDPGLVRVPRERAA